MRRLLYVMILLFVSAVVWSQEERVYSHHSDIVVDTSGIIRVSEKIRIYAEGNVFKRGLVRALPATRTDTEGKRVRMGYDILGVYKNGDKEPFFTEKEGDELVIYIGSKDKLLSPGYYEYEIVYESAGQLGFYEDFDELGWNVNGEMDTAVDLVSCEITLPAGAKILSHRCYTGAFGATDENCRSETFNDDGVFKASAFNLNPHEMLTVYVGFEKGVVKEPVVKESLASKILRWLDKLGLPLMNVIFIVPLFYYYYATWRKHGIDPPKPVVVPQFVPPHNLSPASVGMIYDEHFDFGFVTTSIINLAVKGFLRIEEIERKGLRVLTAKKYRLVKLKDAEAEALPVEEGELLRYLFAESDTVSLAGKYDSNVETAMTKYEKKLRKKHKELLSEGKNYKYMVLPWFVLIAYIALLFVYGRNEPMELYVTLFGFMASTFLAVLILYIIYSAIRKRNPKKLLSISVGSAVLLSVMGVFAYFPINRLSTTAIALLIGMALVIVGHIVYSYLIERPSEKKLQLQADIEGLKMYISLAEEKQMQFFNPPEVTPEVFERLLPYAIALKADKVWGEKFEKTLLRSMQAGDAAYVPLWYMGSAMSPINIGSSLRQSFTSGIQQASANPKSTSGNSWGSGSIGGGFSGGGGGGGRTGGW